MSTKIIVSLCDEAEEKLWWTQNTDIPILVYNKGTKNLSSKFSHLETIKIENIGREEYVYIKYIVDNYNNLPNRVIFTQALPLDHSPDFIKLLNQTENFSPVQPLSFYYDKYVPGLQLLILSKRFFLNNCKIHIEFFDEDLKKYYSPTGKTYYFPGGSLQSNLNLDQTFYKFLGTNVNLRTKMHQLCGIETRQILGHDLTPMCHAALFSVTKEKILAKPKEFYENLLSLSTEMHYRIEQKAFSWIMEMMWLEIFGYDPPLELFFPT